MGYVMSKPVISDGSNDDEFVLIGGRKLLFVLNIDGTLVDRQFIRRRCPVPANTTINDTYKLYLRPGVSDFLDFIMTHPHIDVAIWSNIVHRNLDPIVRFLFPMHSPTRSFSKLKFIWNNDRMDANRCRSLKFLGTHLPYDRNNIVFIDSKNSTVTDDLKANVVKVPLFRINNDADDQYLIQLKRMLEHMVDLNNKDARELVYDIEKKLR